MILRGVAQSSRSNSVGEISTPNSAANATISSTVFIESRIWRSYRRTSGSCRRSSISATPTSTSRTRSEIVIGRIPPAREFARRGRRSLPGHRWNGADRLPRGTDPTGKKEEAQADQVERDQGPQRPPQRPVPPHPPRFVPPGQEVMPHQERPMVQTIKQVVGLDPMPQPHQPEGEEKAQVGSRVLAGEPAALGRDQHKSHVNMIS